MLTVTLLVCAMMALVRADDNSTMLTQVPDTADAACPSGWLPFDGQCFFYDTTPRSWAKAQENCQNYGGGLAAVHTEKVHDRLHTLAEGKPVWIGASDCQETNAWFWSDASYFTKYFWCDLQPNGAKEECCVHMNTEGEKCWDDINCGTQLASICAKKH